MIILIFIALIPGLLLVPSTLERLNDIFSYLVNVRETIVTDLESLLHDGAKEYSFRDSFAGDILSRLVTEQYPYQLALIAGLTVTAMLQNSCRA